MFALEVQTIGVIDDVPIAAVRSFRAATGINYATIAVTGLALDLINGAATGHPARTLRGDIAAETSAEDEVNDRRGFRVHFDLLALLTVSV